MSLEQPPAPPPANPSTGTAPASPISPQQAPMPPNWSPPPVRGLFVAPIAGLVLIAVSFVVGLRLRQRQAAKYNILTRNPLAALTPHGTPAPVAPWFARQKVLLRWGYVVWVLMLLSYTQVGPSRDMTWFPGGQTGVNALIFGLSLLLGLVMAFHASRARRTARRALDNGGLLCTTCLYDLRNTPTSPTPTPTPTATPPITPTAASAALRCPECGAVHEPDVLLAQWKHALVANI